LGVLWTKNMNLTIGDVARRTGASIETIRYYEREGLIGKPPRTDGGRRAYDSKHLEVLSFVRRARELGFSLQDTRTLLAYRGGETCDGVKDLASKHLDEVRNRLRQLTALEALLAKAVDGCPDGKTANCAIMKTLEGKCC
jgi:MerR family mercuric resistance operon transcriptional regulator